MKVSCDIAFLAGPKKGVGAYRFQTDKAVARKLSNFFVHCVILLTSTSLIFFHLSPRVISGLIPVLVPGLISLLISGVIVGLASILILIIIFVIDQVFVLIFNDDFTFVLLPIILPVLIFMTFVSILSLIFV